MIFLLNWAIQVTIILVIGLCWLPLLRKKSASLRHCVLSTALVFATLTPLFNLVMPSWDVSAIVVEHPVIVPLREFVAERVTPDARQGSPSPPVETSELVSRLPVMAWSMWSLGLLAGVIALVTGVARFARVAWGSRPLPSERWAQLTASISSEYGLTRPIELLESRNPSILATWGIFRPKVILPAGAGEWPGERARIVLRHELAHIRRGDWIVQMMAQALRVLYWFNPLVWVVCSRLRLESECACDDAALSSDIQGHEYAAHLLELARTLNKPGRAWSAALTMASPSMIERRFSAMLNPTLNRRPVTRFALSASVTIGFSVTLALSAATIAAPTRSTIASPPLEMPELIKPIKPASTATLTTAATKFAAPVQNSPAAGTTPPEPGPFDRALVEAAEEGKLSDVEQLLRSGANVNAAVPGDGSPLITAAREGRLGVVELLLNRGADPNMAVPGDGNPLIMAAREGRADVVTLLLDRGANIEAVVPRDENALIQASSEGRLNVVQILVSRGANVNARVWIEPYSQAPNGEWRTPLNRAFKEGRTEVARFLISAGARE